MVIKLLSFWYHKIGYKNINLGCAALKDPNLHVPYLSIPILLYLASVKPLIKIRA